MSDTTSASTDSQEAPHIHTVTAVAVSRPNARTLPTDADVAATTAATAAVVATVAAAAGAKNADLVTAANVNTASSTPPRYRRRKLAFIVPLLHVMGFDGLSKQLPPRIFLVTPRRSIAATPGGHRGKVRLTTVAAAAVGGVVGG